ncbi:hypothetical protein [Thermococcus sp.]|uniref:DUF7847 domain-containing protein n=1 Tax=Thermococcus sp. TaxID=35749 RepID=UPI00261D1587|nr:hypothetical protein [Thermococcus sp.]
MRFSLGEVLIGPLDVLSRNADFFILPVFPAVLNAIAEYLRGHVGGAPSMLFALIAYIVSLIVSGALVYMANEELQGRPVRYSEAVDSALEVFPNLLLASIIIAVVTAIGLFLLVIPAIVWLFFVMFTLQEIVIERKEAIPAIEGSIRIVRENLADLVIYFVALLIVVVIVAFPLSLIPVGGYFLATIFLEPYVSVSLTMVYRELQEGLPAEAF